MSDEEQNNNDLQVNGEEQNGSPGKRNKNKSNEEEHKSAEEPHSENGNAPRVEPNLFTLVVHAILELDREGGARFDAIWKFIKSHFGLENERRKLVRATVDESLEAGELIEDGNKIKVNFAKKTEEEGAQEEVPEEETASDKKKRRTKRPAMKKGAQVNEDEDEPAESETPRRGRKRAREASPSPSPKKRGRPAKRAKTELTADVTETPRRRGRPAKNKTEAHDAEEESAVAEEVIEETPKRRGRPPIAKKGKSPKRGRSASPAKAKSSPHKKSPKKTSPNKTKGTPSKTSPSKRGTPSKKASPSKGDFQLPKGWRTEVVARKSGRTSDRADTYWYSPEGIKFRSRVAVLRHLEEQQ